jgi:hypothetical protein
MQASEGQSSSEASSDWFTVKLIARREILPTCQGAKRVFLKKAQQRGPAGARGLWGEIGQC